MSKKISVLTFFVAEGKISSALQSQSHDTEGARDARIFIWVQQILRN